MYKKYFKLKIILIESHSNQYYKNPKIKKKKKIN